MSSPSGAAAPGTSSAGAARPSGPTPTVAPSVGVATLPAVATGADAAFGNGLVAVRTGTDRVQLGADGPGEVAGPGVAVHLDVRNASSAPIDLGGITVNASYGRGTPASPSDAAPAAPAVGTLAPGATARGTWVFSVPSGAGPVAVQVGSTSSANIVVIAP